MSPMSNEMHEGYGDPNSLFIIVGWLIYLMVAYGIAHALSLSHKSSLRLWAICNISPILILAYIGHFSFLPFLGLSGVAFFSYAIGSAVFDNREKERVLKQRLLDDMKDKSDK